MFARQYSDKITDNNVMDGVPYTLYSEDGVFMVKSVNICDWLTHTYGEEYYSVGPYDPNWVDYETSGKALMEWCEKNNSHYYAADREDFFMFEAIRETIEAGKDTVVVEDLS